MKINKHQLIFYCEIHRGTANIPLDKDSKTTQFYIAKA